MNEQKLNSDEIKQVVQLLSKIEPGKLPRDIFIEFTRLTVTPTIEFVPIRKTDDGGIEVLLTKREDDDPIWPGMMHLPGTVIRAYDQIGSFDDAFKRIIDDELFGVKTSQPIFIESILRKVKRGTEVVRIYLIEIFDEPVSGKFYPVNKLPENIIETQTEIIFNAIKKIK